MPPKADLFALGHPRPLSAINGHRFASATVRPNQNDDESDEALHDLVIAGKPLRYSANPPRAVSTLPANRRRLRARRRVIFLVFNEGRLESFPRPKVRRVDFSQAGGVPI